MCYKRKQFVHLFLILALHKERLSCWAHVQTDSMVYDDELPFHYDEEYSGNHRTHNTPDNVIFPDQLEDSSNYKWLATTPSPQEFVSCIRECSTDTNYAPVCGTDDVTYINLERLECRRRCGDDVNIRLLSACPQNFKMTTNPSPTSKIEVLKSCLLLCPSTQEYNPVCGTDNITYQNYGRLVCAQICGADVKLERQAPCPKDTQTTTESIGTSSSMRPYESSKEFLMCLQFCPATSEFNPVCGTNDKTYFNIGRLECAKSCGADVTLLKQSPCSIEISINLNINVNENDASKITTTSTTPRTEPEPELRDIIIFEDGILNNHSDEKNSTLNIFNI